MRCIDAVDDVGRCLRAHRWHRRASRGVGGGAVAGRMRDVRRHLVGSCQHALSPRWPVPTVRATWGEHGVTGRIPSYPLPVTVPVVGCQRCRTIAPAGISARARCSPSVTTRRFWVSSWPNGEVDGRPGTLVAPSRAVQMRSSMITRGSQIRASQLLPVVLGVIATNVRGRLPVGACVVGGVPLAVMRLS